MADWQAHLDAKMQQAANASLLRRPTQLEGAQQTQIRVQGADFVNFSANDYLGWASDEQTRAALCEGAERFGVGSGASHWVVGHTQAHEYLEQQIQRWLGVQSVALFATGYLANLGVISGLCDDQTLIHQDRLNHASLLQSGQWVGRSRRFAHNDPDALRQRLQKGQGARQFVVTDGVFSMDGDTAPLMEYRTECRQAKALLLVDDAHGLGVLGEQGRGSCQALMGGLPDLIMGTLGKSLGCGGAFVAGDAWLVDAIKQFSKPYTYTTALSPALAFAAGRNIQRLMDGDQAPNRLAQRIAYLKTGAQQRGIDLMPSNTAIQPLVVGQADAALALSGQLKQAGLWVTAIRPPTVPAGSARLRIALSSTHTHAQIDLLLDAIANRL